MSVSASRSLCAVVARPLRSSARAKSSASSGGFRTRALISLKAARAAEGVKVDLEHDEVVGVNHFQAVVLKQAGGKVLQVCRHDAIRVSGDGCRQNGSATGAGKSTHASRRAV
jgi:hypothetical protein